MGAGRANGLEMIPKINPLVKVHWVHCAFGNIWSYLAAYSFCTSIKYLYICGMRYAVHYFESVSVPSSSSVSITQ